jgi:opacity protein-like surface antigen
MFMFRRRLLFASMVAISYLPPIWAQTDFSLNGAVALNTTTSSPATRQNPANQAGVLVEARHVRNPFMGYEVAYEYRRANQTYIHTSMACPVVTPSCDPATPLSVSANSHQVSADWITSFNLFHLKPFILAGGGILFVRPVDDQRGARSDTKGVFVYGAGLNWHLLPHMGLRFQYRGNVYKAPSLAKTYTSTDGFTHTAEPQLGVFVRF